MLASKDRSLWWASFPGDIYSPASFLPEMTSFFLPLSSHSRYFPKSSVTSSVMRPPPTPPLEPPSPLTPPEPPDPPDPQIHLSLGEAHAHRLFLLRHITGFYRAHRESELPSFSPSRLSPPGQKLVPPFIAPPSPSPTSCRRRVLLPPWSSNLPLGFPCLGQWMGCFLGQWLICLVGHRWRSFLLGLTTSTLNPLLFPHRYRFCFTYDLKPSLVTKPRLLFSLIARSSACSFSASVIVLPLLSPQVCSYPSLSDSSILGSYWMGVESVALALWNPDLVLTISIIVDSLGSTFVLSSGTFIALVRPFTPVCRFYFELAMLEVDLGQIGQRFLSSFTVPVIMVRWGFYSPHLSFMELIILPNTSLDFSGIVIGSIVVKTVLLGAEARIVVQDGSCPAFVGGLTLEALFPPPCGFSKDYRFEDVCLIDCLCLDSALVELVSSPLSLVLYLSVVVALKPFVYSITMLVDVLVGSALSSHVVSSFNGG